VCTKAFVIGIGHNVSGFVEVRPRGVRGPPRVHLKHHLVVSGLCEYQRKRYTPEVVLFIIIAMSRKRKRSMSVIIVLLLLPVTSRGKAACRIDKDKIRYY